ncbi:transposon Tf2-6 polyprotein [Trichonephila clavipes]|nr:transposon Tf2-6 polyprotein [Trichonephila clavipes]
MASGSYMTPIYSRSQSEVKETFTGSIKETNCPYSAPVTLAFKRDESKKTRLCIDFRKLNALYKADSEPLPIMDSLLYKYPLNMLFKKDAKFNWTDECQNAFEKLKESLITKPVLHLYDPDLTCHVFVDASQKSVGDVLKQPDASNMLHPIAYHSRILRDYEKNYAITELECLVIIDALDKFYYYLHGQKFIIHTDHAALVWLKYVKNLRGRLFR